jgi:hypothetical protein
MRVRNIRSLLAFANIVCLAAIATVSTAQSPGLVAEHFSLALNQPDALARADEAIRAAGLTADPPTAISRGGRKQYIAVIIHCIENGKSTLVDLEVAEIPNPVNNANPLRAFLIAFMKTGKAPEPAGTSFTGEWDTNAGTSYRMKLTQVGTKVTGTYGDAGFGTLEGTVTDGVLRFKWSQSSGSKGAGRFSILPDGSAFAGAWTYEDDPEKSTRPWDGKRIGRAPGTGSTPVGPAASGFAGEWVTKAYGGYTGKMRLKQEGNRVTGSYEGTGNGTIEGTVSGRELRFQWTETNGGTGTGKLTLSEDKTTFAGAYSYDKDPDKADRYWNGKREGAPPATAGNAGGSAAPPDKPAGDPPGSANPASRPRKQLPALGPTLSPPGYQDKRPIDVFPAINLTPAPLPLPALGADREKRGSEKKSADPIKVVRIRVTHKPDITRGTLEVDVELSRQPVGEACVDIYVGGYLSIDAGKRSFCDAYRMATVMSSRTMDQHYKRTFAVPDVLPARVRAEVVAYGTGQVLDHAEETFTAPFPDLFMHKVILWGEPEARRWESGAAFVTGDVPEDRETFFNTRYQRDPQYVPVPGDPWEVGPKDWIIGRRTKGGGTAVDKLPGLSRVIDTPATGSAVFFMWGPKDMPWPSSRPGIDLDSGHFELWVDPTGLLDGRKGIGFMTPNRGYDPNKLVRMEKSLDP